MEQLDTFTAYLSAKNGGVAGKGADRAVYSSEEQICFVYFMTLLLRLMRFSFHAHYLLHALIFYDRCDCFIVLDYVGVGKGDLLGLLRFRGIFWQHYLSSLSIRSINFEFVVKQQRSIDGSLI